MAGRQSKRAKTEVAETNVANETPSSSSPSPVTIPWVAELWGPLESAAVEACGRGRARSRTLGRSELGDAAVPSVPAPPHRSKTRHRGFRRGLRVVLFRHLRRGSRGGRSLGHVRGRRRGPDGGARDAGDHQGVQARRENRLGFREFDGVGRRMGVLGRRRQDASRDASGARRARRTGRTPGVASRSRAGVSRVAVSTDAENRPRARAASPSSSSIGSSPAARRSTAAAREVHLRSRRWLGAVRGSETPRRGGERWRFESYASETEVLLDGAVYAVESASLRGEDPGAGRWRSAWARRTPSPRPSSRDRARRRRRGARGR